MTNNNEKKEIWHRCFLVNLKGCLMMKLKRFNSDGPKTFPK